MSTAYTILFLLIILVAIATWFIPSGTYEYVDGVLLVVRQDWANQSRILDAVQDFPGQGEKLLGCVMNMVKTGFTSYGYGYSSYGYGYSYGKYYQYKGK